jgi:exopolyphosphatase / guanosine-5'-triphosphate,3'-diphosphate pyrophosphatase
MEPRDDAPAVLTTAPAGDAAPNEPVAVIDIGSNSGRMVVFRPRGGGHLDILEDARAPLRLGRALRQGDALGDEAIGRAIEALQDFRAVALGAGATRTVAVATSAVRDASDGEILLDRARREVGLVLRVIDGDREALFGFVGAIHDLPVTDGVIMDVGGGSMELARFEDRRPLEFWTLPLGSLRLSDRYLHGDPPSDREIKELRKDAGKILRRADVPALREGAELVGVGGTIRNLAKVDRRRIDYPLPLLHGYALPRGRLEEMTALMAGRPMSRRRSIPGLNPDRADSIVGGALAVSVAVEELRAPRVLVSSRGLREGVARGDAGLPSPRRVRRASMTTFASRFATWDAAVAGRRAGIAARLALDLDPDARPELLEMLDHAATAVDIGRAVDYYDRFEHAAVLVTAADLGGFSHEDLASMTAILRLADGGTLGPTRNLIARRDREAVSRAGAVLGLADDLNRRIAPGRCGDVRCEWRKHEFVVVAPVPSGWRPRGTADRFHRVFGRRLRVEAASVG